LGLPLVDRPYVQPVSFTVWRSAASAATFTHSPEGHRAAVQRVRRSQGDLVERHSSGRFEPYRCEGTWKGRDAASLTSTLA
jgi:heme-degrading monooxygenase HmoA